MQLAQKKVAVVTAFCARCEARAWLVAEGEITLHEAVDELQASAVASGIVDAIVPEHPDAAEEPIEFTKRLSKAIAAELAALRGVPDNQRYASRLTRYRQIGLCR